MVIIQVRTNKYIYIYRYGATKTILGPARALRARAGETQFCPDAPVLTLEAHNLKLHNAP